jgi:hypothetical protein
MPCSFAGGRAQVGARRGWRHVAWENTPVFLMKK